MYNFIDKPKATGDLLLEILATLFTQDTLVISDTRGLIKREVLPHIPHISYYDHRVLPLLSRTDVVVSLPLHEDISEYFSSHDILRDVEVLFPGENDTSRTLLENILSDKDLIKKLKEKKYKNIISLTSSPEVEHLAYLLESELLVSHEVFLRANDKLLLKEYLKKVSLPTVEGINTDNSEDIKTWL